MFVEACSFIAMKLAPSFAGRFSRDELDELCELTSMLANWRVMKLSLDWFWSFSVSIYEFVLEILLFLGDFCERRKDSP